MEVLQIANDYLNTKLYASLFSSLNETGVSNSVFVPVCKNKTYETESGAPDQDNTRLIVCPCFSGIDRILYFSKQKKIIKEITASQDLEQIHIIHAHTLFSSGYAAMKLKEKYGKPYIAAVRNVDVNVFFKRMIHLRRLGIEIMREASQVIFLSPAYKEHVLETYIPECNRRMIEEKCSIIPNGISPKFFMEDCHGKRIGDKKIRLIYAGEINRNKNLGETIKAAKILKERRIDVSITAVGDVTEARCKEWIRDPLVEHIPYCSQEELLHRYGDADIFVMPSHTETFGLVYAEAMSQGLPVIYTRGQGFDGQFAEGEVGYSVSDNDAEEIAEKILKIKENYGNMSERCVKNARLFDWGKIAGEYQAIYRRLVEEER